MTQTWEACFGLCLEGIRTGSLGIAAVITALADLPADHRREKTLCMYTTAEPCVMCMGALSMSPIRRVVIGSRDDYAGGTRLIEEDWYLERKGLPGRYGQAGRTSS